MTLKKKASAANNVTGRIPELFYETVGPTLEVFVTTGELCVLQMENGTPEF